MIKRFKKIIEIVLDKIIRNYNQQIKASFVRDKYTLRYLLGTKI